MRGTYHEWAWIFTKVFWPPTKVNWTGFELISVSCRGLSCFPDQTCSADKPDFTFSQVITCQTWAGWACQGQLSWEEPQICLGTKKVAPPINKYELKMTSGDPYKQKEQWQYVLESFKGVARRRIHLEGAIKCKALCKQVFRYICTYAAHSGT